MSRRKRLDISNEDRARESARADAEYNQQYINDLKFVASTPQGRRFLGRLIFDECGLVYGESALSAEIHVIAGKRKIGESLLGKLEVNAIGETKKMVTEWFDHRNEWRLGIERAVKNEETEG